MAVPFNFMVENDRMPAGDYTIQRMATGRLRIESTDRHTAASFLAIPKQGKVTAEKAHFIFHRYGGEYFLATIWTPGQGSGMGGAPGKAGDGTGKDKEGNVSSRDRDGNGSLRSGRPMVGERNFRDSPPSIAERAARCAGTPRISTRDGCCFCWLRKRALDSFLGATTDMGLESDQVGAHGLCR